MRNKVFGTPFEKGQSAFKGRHHTEEAKKLMSITRKGKPNLKNSINLRGRKVPEEIVSKIAQSNTGKKRDEVAKRNMSIAQLKASPNKKSWKGGISRNRSEYEKGRLVRNLEKISGRKKSEKCDICNSSSQICFDHDHETGLFRGWICTRCNLVLGLVKDNPKLLDLIKNYLEDNK